jgi:hypothetical protein
LGRCKSSEIKIANKNNGSSATTAAPSSSCDSPGASCATDPAVGRNCASAADFICRNHHDTATGSSTATSVCSICTTTSTPTGATSYNIVCQVATATCLDNIIQDFNISIN